MRTSGLVMVHGLKVESLSNREVFFGRDGTRPGTRSGRVGMAMRENARDNC